MKTTVIKNIRDAVPVFAQAIAEGHVLAMHRLLQVYPRLIYVCDNNKRNALMLAAFSQSPAAFPYLFSNYVLLDTVFDLNDVDKDGLNAYDWAVLGANEIAMTCLAKLCKPDDEVEE